MLTSIRNVKFYKMHWNTMFITAVCVIFLIKWIVFVSRWCYSFGPLKENGHFSHDGIGWKTRLKFVISHWPVSIRLFLVKLLGLRPRGSASAPGTRPPPQGLGLRPRDTASAPGTRPPPQGLGLRPRDSVSTPGTRSPPQGLGLHPRERKYTEEILRHSCWPRLAFCGFFCFVVIRYATVNFLESL